MKSMIAIAAASSLIAFAAPALAQNALTPGSAGVAGSLSGSNPGTGFGWNGALSARTNPNPAPGIAQGANNGWGYNNGSNGAGYGYDNGYNRYGYDRGYGYNYGYGYGMNEGRAAATDY